jgi:hypothetical protein
MDKTVTKSDLNCKNVSFNAKEYAKGQVT